MMEILELCDLVRQTGFELHQYLGSGHLEKVYENGLAHRLIRQGIAVVQQHPSKVRDEDGFVLGDYVADLLVDERLIVEIKACDGVGTVHTAQLLGYLRACNLEHGLLMNFGAPRFQIKKYIVNAQGELRQTKT